MNLAIVCPVGHLDRHGYQNVADLCVRSMSEFADAVYLVQSTDNPVGTGPLIEMSNVNMISGPVTWFTRDENGAELFDLIQIERNANTGLEYAAKSGNDVALVVESNQYIPEAAREPLREYCEAILKDAEPFGWLPRRDQLWNVTFHASLIRPWVFNLAKDARYAMPDSATSSGEIVQHSRGRFSAMDARAVVDCPLEMTVEDLAEKMTYFRMYGGMNAKLPDRFDWDYWKGYSMSKFKQKRRDGVPLDRFGQMVAERNQPDFASREILSAL